MKNNAIRGMIGNNMAVVEFNAVTMLWGKFPLILPKKVTLNVSKLNKKQTAGGGYLQEASSIVIDKAHAEMTGCPVGDEVAVEYSAEKDCYVPA